MWLILHVFSQPYVNKVKPEMSKLITRSSKPEIRLFCKQGQVERSRPTYDCGQVQLHV